METNRIFTNKALKALIIPLFFEQLLVMLVGLADTFVVSYAGEAAVSGVSLVNSFNTVFIFLFAALASGGAVIISQYIGHSSGEKAGEAASQLLMISALISIFLSVIILIFCRPLLRLMFGKVEADVMEACVTYLRISAYSFPALAVYNAGASLYRSMGKTSVTMIISVISNVINVAGNLIGVFVLRAGVAGVAYPSLIARAFSAVAMTALCFEKKREICYELKNIIQWNGPLLKRILGIAVPNGIEDGVHQLTKVALSSFVALFGTYQIAANGVSQSIWSMSSLAGIAMGPAFTTVIGQCMGAGDIAAATSYMKKLTKATLLLSLVWNVLVVALTPLFLRAFALSEETRRLVILLVIIHDAFSAIFFPFAGPFGSGLRAAGDVKYTMTVSVTMSIGVRLLLSVLFGLVFDMKVLGIPLAMGFDFICRGAMFVWRFRSGKWARYKVI